MHKVKSNTVGGGGLKYDGDKPKFNLLPAEALLAEAQVLTVGAVKYSANNWRQGIEYSRLLDAVARHLNSYNLGERYDPESGLNHLAHARASLGFLLAYDENPETYESFNDLPSY